MDDRGCLVVYRGDHFVRRATICCTHLNETSTRCQVEVVVSESVVALDDEFVWNVVINDWQSLNDGIVIACHGGGSLQDQSSGRAAGYSRGGYAHQVGDAFPSGDNELIEFNERLRHCDHRLHRLRTGACSRETSDGTTSVDDGFNTERVEYRVGIGVIVHLGFLKRVYRGRD